MTSFDLSTSYNFTQDHSFTTLNLLTEEKPLSLIDQLYSSQNSSNLSPQILFSAHPKLSQNILQKQKNEQYHPFISHKFIKDLGIGTTFSIQKSEEDDEVDIAVEEPIPTPESNNEEHYSIVYQEAPPLAHQIFKNKINIHFTESRNIVLPKTPRDKSSSTQGLEYFEKQVENLKQNVERLKIALDRTSTSQKTHSQESSNSYRYQQKPINRALVYDSSSSQNVISKLHARSTQSHEVSQTPPKADISVKQFEIDGLSPILCFSPIEQSFNVQEKSSKKLMQKKLSRRKKQDTY